MPLTDPLPETARRRLRLVAWRARRPLAALCAGLAALVAVGLLRPADPPSARVPVAARDLALGTVLAAGDVRLAEVPLALVPAGLADSGGGGAGGGADGSGAGAGDGGVGDAGAGDADGSVTGAGGAGVSDAGAGDADGSVTGAGGAGVGDAGAGDADGSAAGTGDADGSRAEGAGADGRDAEGAGAPDGAGDAAGPGSSPAAEALIGRRLAVAVPAGLPLVDGLFVDDTATGPPGTVVVPVRFADAGVADVLAPGMRVDVVAAALHDGDEATRLARSAVVLAPTGGDRTDRGSGSGGGLLGGGTTSTESAPVLLAVDPEESVALSGAATSRVLSAVIVG